MYGALAEAEAHKHAHYADTPAPFGFKPFGAGTQTELGKSATELLAMLALRIATRRNGWQEPSPRLLRATQRYVRAKVGRAIMSHLAWQVCSAFLDSPSAALKPEQRYRHSAWREASAESKPLLACTCDAETRFGGPRRACYCKGGLQ